MSETKTNPPPNTIPISSVVIQDRVRKSFNNIPELAESIKKTKGLLHPIVVTPHESGPGKYRLIAGERRFRAFLLTGLGANIPATIRQSVTEIDLREMELEENLQRDDMAWDEHAEGLRQLDELKRSILGDQSPSNPEGWSLEKAEKLIGQDRSTISVKIALAQKLKDRPDLKEKIIKLPMQQAMKAIKGLENRERAQRLVDSGQIKITCDFREGDCLDLIKSLPDASVDLFLSDPPFGMEMIETLREGTPQTTNAYISQLKDTDNSTVEKMTEIFKLLAPELKRVLKPTAHFYIFFQFGIYNALVDSLKSVGFDVFETPLIWDKGRSTSAFRGYTYQPRYEPILYGQVLANSRRLTKPATNILEFSPPSHTLKVHPFQKPLELLSFLIEQSTDHGATVLDCFSGSGSTLKAATALARKAIGFELSHDRWLDGMKNLQIEEAPISEA